MSEQWGQQPTSPNSQPWSQQPFPPNPQNWGQQSFPANPQPWGQQTPPNQQQWGQQPTPPNQEPWGQQPIPPNQQPTPPDPQPWGQQQWGQQSVPSNPQQWGQQPANSGWQQPTFNPGQFQPLQPPPKKKRNRLWIILSIIGGILIFSCVLSGIIGNLGSKSTNTGSATSSQTATPTDTSTTVVQAVQPTDTPTATPTPVPTKTNAQIEAAYKASTINTTVAKLDKDGTADQGKDVHFTSMILNFVKDSTGTTAGANVSTQDYSSVIQVAFTAGTDITRLNKGDILEVWGTDQGVFSGTNAFGATIQEVGITANYMYDHTTNYQVNS